MIEYIKCMKTAYNQQHIGLMTHFFQDVAYLNPLTSLVNWTLLI
jgi:hypothetical protein